MGGCLSYTPLQWTTKPKSADSEPVCGSIRRRCFVNFQAVVSCGENSEWGLEVRHVLLIESQFCCKLILFKCADWCVMKIFIWDHFVQLTCVSLVVDGRDYYRLSNQKNKLWQESTYPSCACVLSLVTGEVFKFGFKIETRCGKEVHTYHVPVFCLW